MWGGWRQAGMLAAAAHVALNRAVETITIDHQHARQLADGINEATPETLRGVRFLYNFFYSSPYSFPFSHESSCFTYKVHINSSYMPLLYIAHRLSSNQVIFTNFMSLAESQAYMMNWRQLQQSPNRQGLKSRNVLKCKLLGIKIIQS